VVDATGDGIDFNGSLSGDGGNVLVSSEVKEDLLQQLEADLENKGFKVEDHHLSFYGYCPDCR